MGMLSPFQTAALASSWAPEASLGSLSSMWGSAALGVAEAEEAAPPQDGAVHGLVWAASGRFGKTPASCWTGTVCVSAREKKKKITPTQAPSLCFNEGAQVRLTDMVL